MECPADHPAAGVEVSDVKKPHMRVGSRQLGISNSVSKPYPEECAKTALLRHVSECAEVAKPRHVGGLDAGRAPAPGISRLNARPDVERSSLMVRRVDDFNGSVDDERVVSGVAVVHCSKADPRHDEESALDVLAPMGIKRMEAHAEASGPTCGYGKLGDARPGYPFAWQCESWAGAASWYASVEDLGRFVNGIREGRVLGPKATDVLLKENMGFDFSDPGWVKGGWWVWDEPPRYGNFHSAIGHFPDGVDAVLLSNCDSDQDVEGMLVKTWRESMN